MRGDTWSLQVKFSDVETVCDGACLTSSPTKVTSASAAFASENLNQKVTLAGAGPGGEDYAGRIVAIDSGTQVTTCPSIGTTVSGAELTFGKAVDISGNTLTLTLKSSNADLDPGVLQEIETMPANAESVAGIGHISVPITKTALVVPAIYAYDIQRSVPGSPKTVSTVVYGDLEVLADTTITA